MDRRPLPRPHSGPFLSPLATAVAAAFMLALPAAGGCSWCEIPTARHRSAVLDDQDRPVDDRVAELEDRLAIVSESLRDDPDASATPSAAADPHVLPIPTTGPPRGRP